MLNLKNYEDKVIHCKTRAEHVKLVSIMMDQGYEVIDFNSIISCNDMLQ